MPPKVTITKEMILGAAFDIVQENGFKKLSSRNIAKKLNCSVSPVFTAYQKMSDIENDVMNRAKDLLVEYTKREYTGDILLNQGVGIVVFARDNKQLYKELFMEGTRFRDIIESFSLETVASSNDNLYMKKIQKEQKEMLMQKLRIFAHGLATLTCAGLENNSNEFIIKIIHEAGRALIMDSLDPIEVQNG